MENKGRFIVFEGIDGSGKTTQSRLLANKLEEEGHNVVHTGEPTNNSIGKYIREILADNVSVCHETLALMFAADRHEHVSKVIIPALNSGAYVVCDRYVYSSLAYQGVNSLVEDIANYNRIACSMIKVDYIFYIDVTVDTCLKRLRESRQSYDIFEGKTQLENIYDNYEKLFANPQDNVFKIDGEREAATVAHEIFSLVTYAIKT